MTRKIFHYKFREVVQKITPRIIHIFGSKKLFLIVIGLFVLQAIWMALFARYPMAFDEDYHFGVIKIYAEQWGPFFQSVPPHSGMFGDLMRNPSYLYDYLMSFPYRVITIFIHKEMAQIIIMRLLNVVMFTVGLFVSRRLLLRLGISSALTNFSLLMLILIPVTPFLAAQMNYDNLIFLLLPNTILLTLNCYNSIKVRHSSLASNAFLLFCLGSLACLVKYAFLPIFLGEFLYLLIIYIRSRNKKHIFTMATQGFMSLRLSVKLLLVVGLIVSGGLFTERYGVNIIEYHNINPDCAKVDSIEQCLQYGPWARNYQLATHVAKEHIKTNPNPFIFMASWIYGMMYRLYFAINYNYSNFPPLPLPIVSAYVISVVGFILCCVFWRSMFRSHPEHLLLLVLILLYVGALLYINYTEYLKFDSLVAINGRYLIPLFPLIFALFGQAYRRLFFLASNVRAIYLKTGFTVVTLLLTLQGGGALTHLVRSESDWYWPSQTVVNVNLRLQKTVSLFIIGAKKDRGK